MSELVTETVVEFLTRPRTLDEIIQHVLIEWCLDRDPDSLIPEILNHLEGKGIIQKSVVTYICKDPDL